MKKFEQLFLEVRGERAGSPRDCFSPTEAYVLRILSGQAKGLDAEEPVNYGRAHVLRILSGQAKGLDAEEGTRLLSHRFRKRGH
jgi:hypothetical protein